MPRPNHLFVASDGDMFDTRVPDWHRKPPLRASYEFAHYRINSPAQYKATLRAGPYAWPGGYPMFLCTDDGAALCWECGRSEARNVISAIADRRRDGWRVIGCDVNYEDDTLVCDHCYSAIGSAYGGDERPGRNPDGPDIIGEPHHGSDR